MDLVYLMLNDKGQTEHVQLLNPGGVPQVLDANDPLVARLNTGPGGGKPVQVCGDDGEIVEAMQLTEFHYFVDENNKVIPIPPGSIVQGEFEDEEVEDSVGLEIQNNSLIGVQLSSDTLSDAYKETEIILPTGIEQHSENLTGNDEEQQLMKASACVESFASIALSEDNQFDLKKGHELSETSEFGQNSSEDIFTQDEIELEEEVVSLQVSESESVTQRSPVKFTKKTSGSAIHHDSASVTVKDIHNKVSDATSQSDQRAKSPSRKPRKKQGPLLFGEEQSGISDKTLSLQGIKNINPVVETSSTQLDPSFSDTGRPRRSVPRRSALEMLHGEGKALSRKPATSSGSDSELDAGSGASHLGKRRNSKAVEKLVKSPVIDKSTKAAALSYSVGELSPLSVNENTKNENASELTSSIGSVRTDMTVTSAKRGKGRPRKVIHSNVLPAKSAKKLKDKSSASLPSSLVAEPIATAQQVESSVSSSSDLLSTRESGLVPEEHHLSFSAGEISAVVENSQETSAACPSEIVVTSEENHSAFPSEFSTSAAAHDSKQSPVDSDSKRLKDSSEEEELCISEFSVQMDIQATENVEMTEEQLNRSEDKIDVDLSHSHSLICSELEKKDTEPLVPFGDLETVEDTKDINILTEDDITKKLLVEDEVSALNADGLVIEQDYSQNVLTNSQSESISAIEESGLNFHHVTPKNSDDCCDTCISNEPIIDASVKYDVIAAGNQIDTDQLMVDVEEEEAIVRQQKLADLPVSPLHEAEKIETDHDLCCSSEVVEVTSGIPDKEEKVNVDYLELLGRDEEDIHAFDKDAYLEQEDAANREDFDIETETNSEQIDAKIEICGDPSVHLILDALKDAQKKMKTIEEANPQIDSKTALLILAEIELLASEIQSKLVKQELCEEDTASTSTTDQSWKALKQVNEGRFKRIVSNELMKLRALDEEVDQRYNQLMIARGQLSRKENQVKQQRLVLERSQMLLDIEKEQFQEEQKKLQRDKERDKEHKLYSKLKQSRKRFAESLSIPSSSSKKARISDSGKSSFTIPKHRRPLFEEMSVVKETKAIALPLKSSSGFKNSSSKSISHSLSVSSSVKSSVNDLKDSPVMRLDELKLFHDEMSDRQIVADSDSSPKEVPASSSGASVVVKGKKELLRRFEADELNSPTEELDSSILIPKSMKPETSSGSAVNSVTSKKESKHSRGSVSTPASAKSSGERRIVETTSKSGKLVKKSSSSESKSHPKDSTSRTKNHSTNSGSSLPKDKKTHSVESRNSANQSVENSKKAHKTQKRSL